MATVGRILLLNALTKVFRTKMFSSEIIQRVSIDAIYWHLYL